MSDKWLCHLGHQYSDPWRIGRMWCQQLELGTEPRYYMIWNVDILVSSPPGLAPPSHQVPQRGSNAFKKDSVLDYIDTSMNPKRKTGIIPCHIQNSIQGFFCFREDVGYKIAHMFWKNKIFHHFISTAEDEKHAFHSYLFLSHNELSCRENMNSWKITGILKYLIFLVNT